MSLRPTSSLLLYGLLFILVIILLHQSLPYFRKTFQLGVSPEVARKKRYHLIIDVRSPQEREEWGYYPNSIPISFDQLQKEVTLLIANRDAHLLVYSNGDARAAIAAEKLYHAGYHSVSYLKGTYVEMLPPGSQQSSTVE